MNKNNFGLANLPKMITTTFISISIFYGADAIAADASNPLKEDYMTPSIEDLETYVRPQKVPQAKDNTSTPERIELGKQLFFDPRLSGSNFISCSTCHNPALGWSDGQKTAMGHGMQVLGRATPTILNTAYQRFHFWDGRAKSLEEQALGPIVAAGEMNQPLDELVTELKAIPGYVQMFETAYPGKGISPDTIAKAIAAFERTIIATESDFDRWLAGDKKAMSEEALWGFVVFKGKGNCIACHSGHNFADDKFHNVGLKGVDNPGRYAVEPNQTLKGAFKTPTLRDIELTAPYMHNGAYDTLNEVIEHYDVGGFENAGKASPDMKPSLNLTERDKKALVAFMKSLTGDPADVTVPQLPVK